MQCFLKDASATECAVPLYWLLKINLLPKPKKQVDIQRQQAKSFLCSPLYRTVWGDICSFCQWPRSSSLQHCARQCWVHGLWGLIPWEILLQKLGRPQSPATSWQHWCSPLFSPSQCWMPSSTRCWSVWVFPRSSGSCPASLDTAAHTGAVRRRCRRHGGSAGGSCRWRWTRRRPQGGTEDVLGRWGWEEDSDTLKGSVLH